MSKAAHAMSAIDIAAVIMFAAYVLTRFALVKHKASAITNPATRKRYKRSLRSAYDTALFPILAMLNFFMFNLLIRSVKYPRVDFVSKLIFVLKIMLIIMNVVVGVFNFKAFIKMVALSNRPEPEILEALPPDIKKKWWKGW